MAFDPPVRQPPSFAAACPVPTDKGGRDKIAAELMATIEKAVPPDTLATEWERLNDGAKACRRGR